MRTVYVDSEFKCHTVNDGTMRAVENSFFDGKCDEFINGYCCDDSMGYLNIYPWKDWRELDAAQREYELEQLEGYEQALSEIEAALGVSG